MNHFLNMFVYSALLTMALWYGRAAVKPVGIYLFSRRAVVSTPVPHVCDDPECPATVLILAIDDTHRKVRTEAIVAVIQSLATLVAAAYAFVLVMGRLA
jgi:hypothetical protein